MKRSVLIGCCLLVIFASVAAAWASCKQISFASDAHHRSAFSLPTHDHHSDAQHEHSDNSAIHCLTLEEFVPLASFSAKPDRGEERFIDPFGAESISSMNDRAFVFPIHGPFVFAHSGDIPSYLFLSVLRI